MDRRYFVDTFYFNDDRICHYQIQSIRAIEQNPFVTNRQWMLFNKFNASNA